MPERFSIRQIRRKAMALAVLGVLVSGVLVALVTAVAIYQSARDGLERSTLMGIQAQAVALDNLVQRYEGIARQVTSRTEIRNRLIDYAAGERSFEELVEFTEPRLGDALGSSRALVGLKRLGPFGEVVVDAGETADVPDHSALDGMTEVESRLVPFDGRIVWRAAAPILGEEGERLGTDVLFFEVDSLVDLLADTRGQDALSQGYLFDFRERRLVRVNDAGDGLVMGDAESTIASDLGRLDPDRAGVVWPEHDGQSQVLFYTPVGGGRCLLLVEAPFWSFYQPVVERLALPLLVVLLLLPLVALLSGRALRPVLKRLSSQAEALERSAGELRLAASVFEGTGEAIMITSPHHRLLRVNPAFTRITGFSADEVLGRPLSELFQLDDEQAAELESVCRQLSRKHAWQGEMVYRNKRGELLTALQTISEVVDEHGKVDYFIHIFNDITETKAAEQRIRYQAHHDPLTELPNRASLRYRIDRAVARAGRDGSALALLFLDLDHFKEVNDRLGHAVGDHLLREAAGRLEGLLRFEDTVGRLGGDEFLILLEGLPAPRYAGQVAEKVIEALTRPFVLDGEAVQVGASIGIAVYPDHALDADALINHADAAMYNAKASGRNTYRYFDQRPGNPV
ncbi:MAG: diguanylate cyclase domain-containing protein [Guyparkeria sp.]